MKNTDRYRNRLQFGICPRFPPQRGNMRADVFHGDQDRHKYLSLLAKYAAIHGGRGQSPILGVIWCNAQLRGDIDQLGSAATKPKRRLCRRTPKAIAFPARLPQNSDKCLPRRPGPLVRRDDGLLFGVRRQTLRSRGLAALACTGRPIARRGVFAKLAPRN